MNLLYKLLPDFLKKFFFPAIYNEPEEILWFTYVDQKFKREPCKGTLEIGNHCKGCHFEKDHT